MEVESLSPSLKKMNIGEIKSGHEKKIIRTNFV